MRRVSKLWFLVLVTAVLSFPSPAQAQFQFRTFGGGYFGNFGGYGYGNFGPLGYAYPGYGYPGYGYRGYGYPGVYGMMPYYASPFGGMSVMSSSYINPGASYASPYAYNSIRPEPFLMPGFAASEPVHSRLTFYPAIVEPSTQVIEAALEADDNRARIDMRVPMANALVYLDGVLTKQIGVKRMFVTPPLKPGSRYSLSVEVVWQSNDGRSRTSSRQINLRAGETASLNLQEAD